MVIGALCMIPAISGIIKLFWVEWNYRFVRIVFPFTLVFAGFIVAVIEPSIYAYEKQVNENKTKDIVVESKRKTPDEAMRVANNAMWNYAKRKADESGLRLPIEVETERIYKRVMSYDEITVLVRYPFTYGKDSPIVHSYLFKINYNGSIVEVLDYH